MKTFYSLDGAKAALETMSEDEQLTLKQCIYTAQSLVEEQISYFFDDNNGDVLEIFNLIKRIDCLQIDPKYSLLGLELMITCGGPNTWIKVDDRDNVIVQCYWGEQMEIQLGDVGISLDEISDLYSHFIA